MRPALLYLIAGAGIAAAVTERLLQHGPATPTHTVDVEHSHRLFKGKYTLGRTSVGCGKPDHKGVCGATEMDPFDFANEMCAQGDSVCPKARQLEAQVQAQLEKEECAYWLKEQRFCDEEAECVVTKEAQEAQDKCGTEGDEAAAQGDEEAPFYVDQDNKSGHTVPYLTLEEPKAPPSLGSCGYFTQGWLSEDCPGGKGCRECEVKVPQFVSIVCEKTNMLTVEDDPVAEKWQEMCGQASDLMDQMGSSGVWPKAWPAGEDGPE